MISKSAEFKAVAVKNAVAEIKKEIQDMAEFEKQTVTVEYEVLSTDNRGRVGRYDYVDNKVVTLEKSCYGTYTAEYVVIEEEMPIAEILVEDVAAEFDIESHSNAIKEFEKNIASLNAEVAALEAVLSAREAEIAELKGNEIKNVGDFIKNAKGIFAELAQLSDKTRSMR